MSAPEKDEISGRETTGHEWDGLKELNTPLPRWWLYVFYATVVWAFGYVIVYPALPSLTDYSKGVIGYSSRGELAESMAAVEQSRSGWKSRFQAETVNGILKNPELLSYAMAGGRAVFAENCAPCHAAAGSGGAGYPSLADDDWLWGGTADDIYTSVRYGVRSGHDQARVSDMPNFKADGILNDQQVADVTEHVLSLSGGAANSKGAEIFAAECASCHGDGGMGNRDLGAPNLADAIWLYGSTKADIQAQIAAPKHGVMPAWEGRIDDVSLKQLAVYVHALGGGQ